MREAPHFEQAYTPRYSSLRELAEHARELNHDQEVLEMAHLRYELQIQTTALMREVNSLNDEDITKELQEVLVAVSLSDVPEALEVQPDEERKERLKKDIELVQSYRSQINSK